MRTTVDLPQALVEEACRLSNLRTKREAIIAGLEELIRARRREELRHWAGKVELAIDIARSRGRKR